MKLTNAFVAVFLALTWSHAVTVQAQVMDDNLGGDSFFLEGGANGGGQNGGPAWNVNERYENNWGEDAEAEVANSVESWKRKVVALQRKYEAFQCANTAKFMDTVVKKIPAAQQLHGCVRYAISKCCGSATARCKPTLFDDNACYRRCFKALYAKGDPTAIQCHEKFIRSKVLDRQGKKNRRLNTIVPLIDINKVRAREAARQRAENKARGANKRAAAGARTRQNFRTIRNVIGLLRL